MADMVVIGGGFGGTWFARATGALLLTRSNGHDINTDLDKIRDTLRAEKPRYIVNFASQSMVGESWKSPADWMQTNCVGMTRLLEVMAGLDGLERYVHFTTPEVYGSTVEWQYESWSMAPSTPYAASRACGDWMVKLWHDRYGFPAIFTRAANIYGEGQQLYRLIPKAILAKIEDKAFPLDGGGTSLRAFVHMADVVEAVVMLLNSGQVGDVYHISPQLAVRIRDVVELIGCKTLLAPERPGLDAAYLLRSEKIRALGWKERTPLDIGVEQVERWMRDNPEQWRAMPRSYGHTP